MESPSSVSRFIDADIFKEKQKLVENNCEDFIIKRDLINMFGLITSHQMNLHI